MNYTTNTKYAIKMYRDFVHLYEKPQYPTEETISYATISKGDIIMDKGVRYEVKEIVHSEDGVVANAIREVQPEEVDVVD